MVGGIKRSIQPSRDLFAKRSLNPAHALAWAGSYIFAVAIAAFVGFRLPGPYTMTLYNIRLQDGALRRGLLGTILEPLWSVFGYRYLAMALVAFAFLGLLLVVGLIAILGVRWTEQRLLIIFWFLSPAGGYLFHEVGYTDQVVYVLFFVAAWAIIKSHFITAIVMTTFSVFLHELTLFTTLPLLLVLSILRGEPLRRLVIFSTPVLVGLLIAAAPMMTQEQIIDTRSRLQQQLPFPIRTDAVALFGRSLGQTWDLDFFSPIRGLVTALPLLVAVVVSMAVVFSRTESTSVRVPRAIAWIAVIGATISPFLLIFFGWDFYRWMFLGTANFLILILMLWSNSRERPLLIVFAFGLVPTLALFVTPLHYFDGYSPRSLTPEVLESITVSGLTDLLSPPGD